MLTLADELFERFCAKAKLPCERIPEGKNKSPDYRILVSSLEVVVEVKQLDPNEEELEQQEALGRGEIFRTTATPGNRVRHEISKANRQLAAAAKSRCPAILVLYNNVPLRFHTDPYQVKVGMYGLEQLIIALPDDHKRRSYIAGWKFGPKRRLTPEHNTTISAIGVIVLNQPGDLESPQLIIYHNAFAKIPLPVELLQAYGVKQYVLEEADLRKRQEWIPCGNLS